MIGNYDKKPVSDEQYHSLELLVKYLAKKYDIDFSKKVPFFKWCNAGTECLEKPLTVNYDYPLVGHRDA